MPWMPVPLLLPVALLRLSTGLRVGDRPALGRSTARERAAREAGECGRGEVPADFARREGGARADCDDLIPRYDMAVWSREHGNAVPDHAAVFINTGTHEAEFFPTMEVFLQLHGEERVVALPEYAQSGSHLKDPGAEGRVNGTFRELADTWNDTFVYFSDFKCKPGSLCHAASLQFGAPAVFATTNFQSKNFLVGGPDSGLPFHKHGMTWQGLSMGRKAWYVMPPGSMTQELHDETGPYIFPVRAYHGSMLGKPLGQRPFYCVQHPGEVFYVPEAWWHATMNLDRFQVAYGEKPSGKHQQKPQSDVLTQMLEHFPEQAFDSAGRSSKLAGGPKGDLRPMPYTLAARQRQLEVHCGLGANDTTRGLEEPLRRMRALAGSRLMACGLAETAAFAHCEVARTCERASNNLRKGTLEGCPADAALIQDLKQRSVRMVAEAAKLSPSLVEREHAICRSVKV